MAIVTNSRISIISTGLLLLGEKPLTALNDNRYGATVGVGLFDLLFEDEIQSNTWRFAHTKKSLSRLVAEPLNQYKYSFLIPPDCLVPSHVWPRADYEIFGRHLWTNQSAVDLDYRFKPEIAEVPAYFALLLSYRLAYNMVNPVTEGAASKVEIMKRLYDVQRARAQFADAQGRPSKPIQDNPFTDVR
jgi:hypothetical protein